MMATSLTPRSRVRMASHQHRVLIYTTCYNVLDGVTLTIRKLEQEILAAGHHVCVLTTRSGDTANTDLDGVHPNRQVVFLDNAVTIPFLNDPEHPELTYQLGFAISKSVRRQIDEFEPSIIHITVPDCTSLHIIQYARKKEIPIMGTYHSNIPEYMEHYPGFSWLKPILSIFFRHQYNFLQALYVPTPFIKKHLIDNYRMDRCTTLKVWGRGVDVVKFNPSHRSMKYRRSLGIADDTCVVLWVGRLVPEKRPDIFGKVIRKLHERGLKYHALVVGAGPCEEEIKALPNTTFAGWMNSDQLATAYASSDVFLFPSSVETFGNVTLEAEASGLPVVVEAGCSGHLVNEGQNGHAVAAGDEEGFFEATLSFVEDKSLREEFRLNSRELALTLEKSAVVRQMLDNYSRVTDEFYMEYGGHHCNRDNEYKKPDSFNAGNHPRPVFLIMVEWLFIFLFSVAWNMSVMFTCMQDTIAHREVRRSKEDSKDKSHLQSTPLPSPVNSPTRKNLLKETQVEPLPCSFKDRHDSIVDMEDIEIGSKDEKDDDGTETTGSSSEGFSATSSQTGQRSKLGDKKLSYCLATAFIQTVQLQCRVESAVRNFFSKSSGAVINGIYAKRKNSSMAFNPSGEKPDTMIGRNRVTDTVTTMSPIIDESVNPDFTAACLQDSRIMRRNQSTVLEVHT